MNNIIYNITLVIKHRIKIEILTYILIILFVNNKK